MENIWVTSGPKRKNQPMYLMDRSIVEKSGEFQQVDITEEMAKKGIGVEVVLSDFIDHKLTEGLLFRLPDPKAAKDAFDAFKKKREVALKKVEKDKDDLDKVVEHAVKDVKKTVKQTIVKEKDKVQKAEEKPSVADKPIN